jgi:hypothetical protein
MTEEKEVPEHLRSIEGVDKILLWFGYWPRFHDSNILDVNLVVNGVSTIRLHAFQMTSKLDDRGYYVLDKHCQITFKVSQITQLSFTADNLCIGVLFGLSIDKQGDDFILEFDPSAGLYGSLRAKKLALDLEPYSPA